MAKRKLKTHIVEPDFKPEDDGHQVGLKSRLTIEGMRYRVYSVYGLFESLGLAVSTNETAKEIYEGLRRDNVVARLFIWREADGRAHSIYEYGDGTFSWPEDLGYMAPAYCRTRRAAQFDFSKLRKQTEEIEETTQEEN